MVYQEESRAAMWVFVVNCQLQVTVLSVAS